MTSIITIEDMQVQALKGRAVCSFDFAIQTDDRIIQLSENIAAVNRTEWKIGTIYSRTGQYWAMDVIGLVGAHG